jgi:hypothetical protein
MRVAVTRIEWDGTMRRRMVDTAGRGDAGDWQVLAARALAFPPPYRPAPGGPVYHLRAGERDVLVADHDLSGPLSDLITAVLAWGEAVLAARARPGPGAGSQGPRVLSLAGDAVAIITGAGG